MSIITKLISMVALGQTAVETRVAVQGFLTGLASVLVLALVAGLMIGALLVGAHVIVYQLLLSFTVLTPLEAMGIVFALGVVITAIIVCFAARQLKHVFNLPKQMHVEAYEQPITSRVAGIAEAFLDGLTGRTPRY